MQGFFSFPILLKIPTESHVYSPGEISAVGRVAEDVMIRLACPEKHVVIGVREARCLKGGLYNDTIGECKRVCDKPTVQNADVQIYQPAKIGKFSV